MDYNYTDLQLQLWLAKQLPEHIDSSTSQAAWLKEDGFGITWSDRPVTDREWDHVARMVEDKLEGEQYDSYVSHLDESTRYNHGHNSEAVRASWQSRTIALSQTLSIPIK